jgi:hypothetical protein
MPTNFCSRISQLTQLTSPERFDQMKYVEQQEESLHEKNFKRKLSLVFTIYFIVL